jgi:peptidyl-prolyl cis-trans isomerase C
MASQIEAITIVSGVGQRPSEDIRHDGATGSQGARRSIASRLLREPLIHFLLAGGLLFVAGTFLSREKDSGRNQTSIHVSAAEIKRLAEVWSRQYGRGPESAQMKNLVDEYIREEILYREAMASGLDKDDTIIRRRLVEKMEFLSQEVASAEPSESELKEFSSRNREKFRVPAQVAFSHIYFSISKRGPAAETDAVSALATLRSKKSRSKGSSLGDTFMLQSEYPAQTQEEIKGLFGDAFARRLFQFRSGQWEGPIRSSYGFHLVRISQYMPSRLPELLEVRNQVVTDFKNQRLQHASEAYYARLRSRYRVDVDDAALAAAPSSAAPNSRSAQESATVDED